jgi:hypothetical protein
MTNLMQQLQAWADRGAFKFPEGDDKGGFTMIKEDSNNPNIGAWELTPEQNFGIKCVLDGTIQVWRPVEHYPQPLNGVYLGWNGKLKCHMLCNSGGDVFTREFGMIDVTHWQPLPQPPQEGAMLELEPIVLNEKNHYIMYTLVEDFGGCDHIFENGERRMVWHRQSAFDTKEEVMAHFEDYCQKYPNMSYIIVTPKIYLEEPHKTIVAGLITARTIYSGVDQWTRSVNKLSEDYNIIAERRVK